jgi:hypothetical protein
LDQPEAESQAVNMKLAAALRLESPTASRTARFRGVQD